MAGQITLGDLQGMGKQTQYELAKVGHTQLTRGDLNAAQKIFLGLLALDPYDAYFHTALGSIAQQRSDLKTALKHYDRALEINPYAAVTLAHRGEVHLRLGNLAKAADDLVAAMHNDPEMEQPSTKRARLMALIVRQQLERAQSSLGDGTTEASATPPASERPPPAAPEAEPGIHAVPTSKAAVLAAESVKATAALASKNAAAEKPGSPTKPRASPTLRPLTPKK